MACVVPVVYFVFVWHYGLNQFADDDWSRVPLIDATLHGHLTFALLWGQYNENRMLVPNLLWAFFGVTTHADTKTIMVFDACLFIAGYAFLLMTCRHTFGRWLDPVPTVLVGLVWFSLADWQNAMWGFQMAWYLILFFLMAMLLLLAREQITPMALIVCMVLAIAASFSSLQGLFLWPVGLLGLLWRLEGRSRRLSFAGPWIVVAAVTAGLYFHHYLFSIPAAGAGIGYAFDNPNLVVVYLLAAVGNVFPIDETSVALHALIGLPLCIGAAWVLVATWRERNRTPRPRPLPLPAALIVFAVLFDISIALGRVSLGMSGALASRYTMANLLLVLGIVLFALPRLPRWLDAPEPRAPRTLAVAALATLLVLQIAAGTVGGLDGARSTLAMEKTAARIATNLTAVPVAARSQLVKEQVFPDYPALVALAHTAHHDQLAEFSPGPYRYYRKLGPPHQLVLTALAAIDYFHSAWCQQTPGQTMSHVVARLGPPSGHAFAPFATTFVKKVDKPIPYDEWDVGNDIFVAVPEDGRVALLYAFSATIPHLARDIPCGAVRGVDVSPTARLTTRMIIPRNGATVSGTVPLAAIASGYFGTPKVEFRLTGPSHNGTLIGVGKLSLAGWVSIWNTTTVANGIYSLQTVVYDAAGRTSHSGSFTVTVDNQSG